MSYADSIAIGRVSSVGQVKGQLPNKARHEPLARLGALKGAFRKKNFLKLNIDLSKQCNIARFVLDILSHRILKNRGPYQ